MTNDDAQALAEELVLRLVRHSRRTAPKDLRSLTGAFFGGIHSIHDTTLRGGELRTNGIVMLSAICMEFLRELFLVSGDSPEAIRRLHPLETDDPAEQGAPARTSRLLYEGRTHGSSIALYRLPEVPGVIRFEIVIPDDPVSRKAIEGKNEKHAVLAVLCSLCVELARATGFPTFASRWQAVYDAHGAELLRQAQQRAAQKGQLS